MWPTQFLFEMICLQVQYQANKHPVSMYSPPMWIQQTKLNNPITHVESDLIYHPNSSRPYIGQAQLESKPNCDELSLRLQGVFALIERRRWENSFSNYRMIVFREMVNWMREMAHQLSQMVLIGFCNQWRCWNELTWSLKSLIMRSNQVEPIQRMYTSDLWSLVENQSNQFIKIKPHWRWWRQDESVDELNELTWWMRNIWDQWSPWVPGASNLTHGVQSWTKLTG